VRAMRIGAALMTVAVAAPAAACGGSDDSASAAGSTSPMRLQAHRTEFQPIYQSKRGSRPGDAFVASSEVAGGGHKEAYCVFSPRRRTTWCAVTVVVPRGQITAEGVFTNAPRSAGTIAVLSGSGAFAGARGTLSTTGVAAADESITVRLL
jgi:hypothetical protein